MKHLAATNRYFLQFLSTTSPSQRTLVLKQLNPAQLRLVTEILLNCIKGVIVINSAEKRRLKAYKDLIRKVIKSSLSRERRKQLLAKLSSVIPLSIRSFLRHESRVGACPDRKIQTSYTNGKQQRKPIRDRENKGTE